MGEPCTVEKDWCDEEKRYKKSHIAYKNKIPVKFLFSKKSKHKEVPCVFVLGYVHGYEIVSHDAIPLVRIPGRGVG